MHRHRLHNLTVGIGLVVLSACASTPSIPVESTADRVKPVLESSNDTLNIKDEKHKAEAALKAHDFETAYALYQSIILREPNDPETALNFGNAALAIRQNRQAYEIFHRLAGQADDPDIAPMKTDITAGLVLSEIGLGQSADVKTTLDKALRIAPNDPRLWNRLGQYHDQNQNWIQAQETYIKALENGLAWPSIVNNLGLSLLMQGRQTEALEKFKQAVKLAPDVALYDNNRRLALALGGQYRDAIKGLPDRRVADMLNDAGYVAMTQGDTIRAKTLFERAIELSPSHHKKAHTNLAALKTKL